MLVPLHIIKQIKEKEKLYLEDSSQTLENNQNIEKLEKEQQKENK